MVYNMKILPVVSQKGGVGKTSLVQNLGAELAIAGHRVLLIDFDPQSNLSIGWGLSPGDERKTIYDALKTPKAINECVVSVRDNLSLIPANLDLAGAELAFVNDYVSRPNRLKNAITKLEAEFDYILIDGPPSLGFFTVNALMAATDILIPLQTQAYALRALEQLMVIVDEVSELNPALKVQNLQDTGIVLTMHNNTSLTETVEEMARQQFGTLVFKTVIPVNVRIAEAPIKGQPVGEYDPNSKGALAYKMLAQEILHG
jgi:chromosome partitioning protein